MKTNKKLILKKETIASLTGKEMNDVKGGKTTSTHRKFTCRACTGPHTNESTHRTFTCGLCLAGYLK